MHIRILVFWTSNSSTHQVLITHSQTKQIKELVFQTPVDLDSIFIFIVVFICLHLPIVVLFVTIFIFVNHPLIVQWSKKWLILRQPQNIMFTTLKIC